MPTSAAMRCAVARLSPDSMTARTPSALSARIASAAVSRVASAIAMTATALPSIATCTVVRPCPASSAAREPRPSRLTLSRASRRLLPIGEAPAFDDGEHAVTGDSLERFDPGQRQRA